jgi:hypothetical protein
VKHKIVLYFASLFLFGFLFAAADATAQTISYRQNSRWVVAADTAVVRSPTGAPLPFWSPPIPELFLTRQPSWSQCSSMEERQ